MKNAEEIYKQMIAIMPFKEPISCEPYILEAMRVFAHEACIEQKRLCAEEVKAWDLNLDNNEDYVEEAIYKAHLAVIP